MSSRLALAVSAAALVVAVLGSTPVGHALASAVPRNSVGPLQLKRNAVGPSKVAPNAIRSGHVLDGSLLTADFKAGQIPQGPKGDKGEKGDQGPPGISARQVVTTTSGSNSDNLKQLTANCPTGKVPIGGGGGTSGAVSGVAVRVTEPSNTGWYVSALEVVANNGNWSLRATVVCAKVAP
jgi:hypothetical protein